MFVQLFVRLTQYLLQMKTGHTVSRDYNRVWLRYNWVVIKMNTVHFILLLLWKHDKINYLPVILYTSDVSDLY